jgi:hypothetical protein
VRPPAALLSVCLLVAYAGAAAGASIQSPELPTVATASQQFFVEDIKAAMRAYIAAQVDAAGVFHMRDDKTGEVLALKFVKIHDPVRQIDGDTYFACTDFHVVGDPEKLYDLDFWMDARTGPLAVYDSKVHKEPRHSLLYGWYKQPRYTFVDDRVVSLY